MNPTVAGLLENAANRLAAQSEARREVQFLLGHVLGVSRAWLAAHDDDAIDPADAANFQELVQRREAGVPVAYLVGNREFYSLDFRVTPDVLIPRADTETLVDAALEKISLVVQWDVLDLGTGSGCVAIAIAHERRKIRMCAVDVSSGALEVARENAAALDVAVEFLQSSWFAELGGRRFDLIVSNPPYVATADPHLLQGDLRFEPAIALASGKDGLDDIRRIISQAPACLTAGGWLLFEHGHEQAEACRDLLHESGFGELVNCTDIAGLPRVAGGGY